MMIQEGKVSTFIIFFYRGFFFCWEKNLGGNTENKIIKVNNNFSRILKIFYLVHFQKFKIEEFFYPLLEKKKLKIPILKNYVKAEFSARSFN